MPAASRFGSCHAACSGLAGNRAAKIVADMLQFSRKRNVDKTFSNLNQLIDNTLEIVSQDYSLVKHYDFKHIKIIKDFK